MIQALVVVVYLLVIVLLWVLFAAVLRRVPGQSRPAAGGRGSVSSEDSGGAGAEAGGKPSTHSA